MLQSLKGTDRYAELVPVLEIGDGQIKRRARRAEHLRSQSRGGRVDDTADRRLDASGFTKNIALPHHNIV